MKSKRRAEKAKGGEAVKGTSLSQASAQSFLGRLKPRFSVRFSVRSEAQTENRGLSRIVDCTNCEGSAYMYSKRVSSGQKPG